MTLKPGERVGPYAVVAGLGAGGMGEVYRARDSQLDRDVALKVLSHRFAGDPERLARLKREARLLAALDHPNIAVIHGLEEAGGTTALVLELVEGETLARRLARGALPLAETLHIASQVAAALEAAHARGIIHRDLKPANVKVRPDGTVKVLDFGLAKALAGEALDGSPAEAITMTADATRAGVIVGTPAYMSPEQLRGAPLGRQADIWAFGCVLYEMLVGRPSFAGATVSDTVAMILSQAPDWSLWSDDTPRRVRDLVRRCLRKNTARRLRDIGDARLEIEDALNDNAEDGAAAVATQGRVRRYWMPTIAGAALLALGLTAWLTRSIGVNAPRDTVRFTIEPPSAAQLIFTSHGRSVALSPDGRTLVFLAAREGVRRLYQRRLAAPEAEPIPYTEGALNPFFSPDGRWIGFTGGGTLKKIPADGGLPAQHLRC